MKGRRVSATERYPAKWGNRSSHQLIMSSIDAGEGRRALDVGCARGHLLGELVSRGWESLGIDSDSTDVAICIDQGLDAVVLDITDGLPASLGSFDLVVLADVLEHLPDPLHVLRSVHSLLEPGAKVVISVPNVAHMSVRLMLLFGQFRYSSRGILDRTHLRFFTRHTLTELLADAGFRPQRTDASAVPLELIWPTLETRRFGRAFLRLNSLLPSLWKRGFANQFVVIASSNENSSRPPTPFFIA